MKQLEGDYNKFLKYNVVSAAKIFGPLKRILEKIGITVIPGIPNFNLEVIKTTDVDEDGSAEEKIKAYVVSGAMSYKLVNSEDSSDFIETTWALAGTDGQDPAKALGKALTYSHKYFFRTMFTLSEGDDPDEIGNGEESSSTKNKSGSGNRSRRRRD